jgi:hypothetical protein
MSSLYTNEVSLDTPVTNNTTNSFLSKLLTKKYRIDVFSKLLNNGQDIEHDIEMFHEKHPNATKDLLQILKKAILSGNNDKNLVQSTILSQASTPSSNNMVMPANFSGSNTANADGINSSSLPSPHEAGCVIPQISCLRPRGKHDVEFHKNSIIFRAKKVEKSVCIPLENIERVFVLKRVEKYQKQEVTSFAIRLRDDCEIKYGKQILDELVVTLKTKQGNPEYINLAISDASKLPTTTFSESSKPLPSEFSEATREDILSKLFKYFMGKKNMIESSRQIFCSSIGDTCVKCIVGVENGHLYPLSNGVYFLNKPYIFLSFDDMVGLEQGRAGSGRTSDFIITMDNGDVHQFGMISTDETENLAAYMQYVSKKISKKRLAENDDGSESGNGAKEGNGTSEKNQDGKEDVTDGEGDNDDDDDDDDDFDLEEAKNNLESDSETSESDDDDDDEDENQNDGVLDDSDIEDESPDSTSVTNSTITQNVEVIHSNEVTIIDDSADDDEEEETGSSTDADAEEMNGEVAIVKEPLQKKQKISGGSNSTKQKQSSISNFFVKRS